MEILNFKTKDLSVRDFLVVHKGCEIETLAGGTIVGGPHALTIEKGCETDTFRLRCVTHDVTSKEFLQEFPRRVS